MSSPSYAIGNSLLGVALGSLLSLAAHAQGPVPAPGVPQELDFWVKYSPEVILRFPDHRYEIRWRPMDHVWPLEGIRTDIMVGYRFRQVPLRAFNYAKFDTRGRMWNGARVDFTPKLFAHGQAMLQLRYFQGLAGGAQNQVYAISFAMYPLDLPASQQADRRPQWYSGLFSFGRHQFSPALDTASTFYFIGPLLYWIPDGVIGLLTAFTYDVGGPHDFYWLWRIQIRLSGHGH